MADFSLEEFSRIEYWEKRYAAADAPDSYEWFRTFHYLGPFFQTHLPHPQQKPKILHLGSGDSMLPKELHRLGYTEQTSIDFSPTVIRLMRARQPHLDWQVMDIRELKFADESFDVAVDKATLDAMLHGSLWDPPEDVRSNVGTYVDEVARVLKPGAKWLYVAYQQPHFIKPLLHRPAAWTVDVQTLSDSEGGVFEFYGYVMTKHSVKDGETSDGH
ncbi:MAG: hypothetical protein M1832_001655 [Thelocarpon impressellum]|nr:MAG: hypothetical protein M1832_001655 [Thelocarpon impressellum]